MTRAADNAIIELWRVQARLGIKPAERCIPARTSEEYERDLDVLRKLLNRDR
jgi:hypothetical protein